MPWTEATKVGIVDVAPLSRNEIFCNTSVFYPNPWWPMATLQPNGVPTSTSWNIVDWTTAASDPIPHDVVAVDVTGILAITMSSTVENVDLRLWFGAPSMIPADNSYTGQVECVNLAQGQRSPLALKVKCDNGVFAFAWWFGNGVTQEQIDPVHATCGFSLHVPAYYR